jgi:hypothetical protein
MEPIHIETTLVEPNVVLSDHSVSFDLVGFQEILNRIRKDLGWFELVDIFLTPLSLYLAISFTVQSRCAVTDVESHDDAGDVCSIEVTDLCVSFSIAVAINFICCMVNVGTNCFELWFYRRNVKSASMKVLHDSVINYSAMVLVFVVLASWRVSKLESIVWIRLTIVFKSLGNTAWVLFGMCKNIATGGSDSMRNNVSILLFNILPVGITVYLLALNFGCATTVECIADCDYSVFDSVSCSDRFSGNCGDRRPY